MSRFVTCSTNRYDLNANGLTAPRKNSSDSRSRWVCHGFKRILGASLRRFSPTGGCWGLRFRVGTPGFRFSAICRPLSPSITVVPVSFRTAIRYNYVYDGFSSAHIAISERQSENGQFRADTKVDTDTEKSVEKTRVRLVIRK